MFELINGAELSKALQSCKVAGPKSIFKLWMQQSYLEPGTVSNTSFD